MNIEKSSPLYSFWISNQDEKEEEKRLLKIALNEPASNLFEDEPYKWENLYQSIIRKIIAGDESSIKGLMILLSTLNKNEKDITINALEKFLDKSLIYKLKNQNYNDIKSSHNLIRSISIFFNIFTNPYGIVIKGDINHIYEKTGMFFYNLRKVFNLLS